MFRLITLAVLGTAVFWTVLHAQSPGASDQTLKPLSEVLGDWKYTKRVTLDVADVPLKEVMKELERQSGLHFESFSGDEKLSLKLKEAPFWKAVAETSIRANLPIWVYKKKEIHFNSVMEYVYPRYQIIGPFHVGIHWAPKMLKLNDGQVAAAIVVHAECLGHEGSIGLQGPSGISDATLEDANGKPMVLRQVQVLGKQYSGRGYFVVPEEMFKKRLKLRARFEGAVFLTPEEIVVPASAGDAIEFKPFGGIKARITKVGDGSLEYRIEWDSKLRGADAQRLEEIQKRTDDVLNGGKPFRDEELAEMQKWFAAKAGDMRQLHAIDHVVLDKDKKAISPASETKFFSPKHITAEIHFEKGIVPAQVRIRLVEKKIIKGYLEFNDVFSATPR
ncbi:MAG: hypothetical protein HY289_08725 [Planctomycetes bacterium]|nr:hypothetical protein [Planctomycetota bacterium]